MSKIATRDAYGKALAKLGQINSNVVVLDADLSKSTKTADFKEVFPERFFNMGIAEANLMGASAGLAAAGKIPFASTFAVFASGRGFEIIRNSICYPKLNVKICATHAGITVGEDGASHQALEDIAIMRSLPNMSVIVPADGVETEKAIFSIADYSGPVYTRLGRSGVPTIFSDDYEFELGKGVQLTEGDDVAIIACGIMVSESLEAAKLLQEKGIKARVINMSSIKPIDAELIVKAAKETGAVVTAEEHNIIGGLGSAVAEVLSEECPVPVKRIGVNDTFGESGDPKELVVKYGLTANDIVNAATKVIQIKG